MVDISVRGLLVTAALLALVSQAHAVEETEESPHPSDREAGAEMHVEAESALSPSLTDVLGVVEGASGYEKPIVDTPQSVTVITGEQVRRWGLLRLPELLHHVAGVDVVANSGDAYNVAFRDATDIASNNLLVLVDRHPLTTDFNGEIDWASLPVTLANIERIEILRGPASTVYGANAVTGVINIVRKNPFEGLGTSVDVSGGTGRSLRVEARHSGFTTGYGYFGSVAIEQSGTMSFGDSVTKRLAADLGATLYPSERDLLEITVGAGRATTFQLNRFATRPTESLTSSLLQSLRYQRYPLGLLGQDALIIKQSFHHFEMRPLADDSGRVGELRSLTGNRLDGELAFRFSFSGIDETVVGAHARFMHADTSGLALETSVLPSYAGFLREELTLMEHLLVTGGLRIDYSSLVPRPKASFNLGIVLRASDDHHVRLAAGSAFRNPTLVEVAGLNQDVGSGLVYLAGTGSEKIRPPESMSVELGYRGRLLERIILDVAAYFNETRNEIVQEHRAVPSTFVNKNSPPAVGGEGEVRFVYSPYVSARFGFHCNQPFKRKGLKPRSDELFCRLSGGLSSEWLEPFSCGLRALWVKGRSHSSIVGVPPTLEETTIDPRVDLSAFASYALPVHGLAVTLSAADLLSNKTASESPYALGAKLERRILLSLSWRDNT